MKFEKVDLGAAKGPIHTAVYNILTDATIDANGDGYISTQELAKTFAKHVTIPLEGNPALAHLSSAKATALIKLASNLQKLGGQL